MQIWTFELMIVVIPMAGNSQRFKDAGYVEPKFKLTLADRSVFSHVIRSFENYFSKIFGISFVTSFFLVIFTNIGMVTGIIPVVGVPLPLCSYGGSAILSNFIGFGIILSGYNYRDFKLHNI